MSSKLSLASSFVTLVALSNASPRFSHGLKTDHNLVKRNIIQGACSSSDFNRFASDYNAGIGYANQVNSIINPDNFFWETFMPQDHQTSDDVSNYQNNYLTPFAGLGSASGITVTINCRSSSNPECNNPPSSAPPGYQSYAVTDASTSTITLCDAYFSQPPDSSASNSWCTDGRTLDEFETGGFTLLHEFGHLNYQLQPPLQDYAYGSAICADLAESYEDEAWNNADSWMLVAMGAYWSNRCGHDIDLTPGSGDASPQAAPSLSTSASAQQSSSSFSSSPSASASQSSSTFSSLPSISASQSSSSFSSLSTAPSQQSSSTFSLLPSISASQSSSSFSSLSTAPSQQSSSTFSSLPSISASQSSSSFISLSSTPTTQTSSTPPPPPSSTLSLALPPPPPPPPAPAYAPGTCHIHINEYEIGCQNETTNLHAEITMWDNSGKQIGYTQPAGDANNPMNFPGINAGASLQMTSALPSTLVVTGEHENDYVQFTLNSNPPLSWTSRDTQGTVPGAYCNNGGWDPKDGSWCYIGVPGNAKNQIDCWFSC